MTHDVSLRANQCNAKRYDEHNTNLLSEALRLCYTKIRLLRLSPKKQKYIQTNNLRHKNNHKSTFIRLKHSVLQQTLQHNKTLKLRK